MPAATQNATPLDLAWRERYEVLARLGSGGFAEVFEARDRRTGRHVALKVVGEGRGMAARVVREIEAATALSHPNIVSLYDYFSDGQRSYLVWELVVGRSLAELGGRLSDADVAAVGSELLDALGYAHGQRIVHRDVKPQNVMLDEHGRVKVMDFGIALMIDAETLTAEGDVIGTLAYMSPEQAAGRRAGPASDVYSAGIVLYELLSNRQLFRGKTDVETLELVRAAEVPPLSKLNPEVPEIFERIVYKALAKDPRKRYSSAREMGDELLHFLFDNNLKVTSYDLQAVIRRLIDQTEDVDEHENRQRIEDLIEEEILNLSMIGHLTEVTSEGSRPIKIEALHIDIPAQHDLADVWSETGTSGPSGAESGATDTPPRGTNLDDSDLMERLEGSEPEVKPLSVEEQRRAAREKDGKGPSAATIFIIAILAAAVIAAVLFFFVFSK